MTRIVYLHQYFGTPQMSGGTRSYEWATRLAARGFDVHVVTQDERPGARRRVTEEGGAQVHWLPVRYDNAMSVPRRLWAFLEFAVRASRTARRLRGDVVFATSTPLTIALPALFAVLGRRTPMVFEVRDLWPEVPIAMGGLRNPVARWAALRLERLAYSHATRVVALSPEMRAGVARTGYPRDAIALVPNASDIHLFRRPGVADEGRRFRAAHDWLGERPLVLYAGTLGKANDVGALLDLAVATARLDPEVRFLVVGEGAEQESLTRAAEEAAVLGHSFFVWPSQPKETLPALLSAATVTTSLFADIPALAANSPNKLFDSLAAGRAVVTNRSGSAGDLLTATGAGLVIDREPGRAAEQLLALLSDPDRLAEAHAAAARLADEHFARDVLFPRLATVVDDALSEGKVVRTLTPPSAGRAPAPVGPWWESVDPA